MPIVFEDQNEVPSFTTPSKECWCCGCIYPLNHFKKDASKKDGRVDQCDMCAEVPRLSTEEHTLRQRETNYKAAGKQRFLDKKDYLDERSRWGRPRHHTDLLSFFQDHIRGLYVKDGKFVGDVSMYKVWDRLEYRPCEDGSYFFSLPFDPANPTFEYIGYIPMGWLPEFDIVEFDDRNVPIRKKHKGWRTVLLELIRTKVVTRDQVEQHFGPAIGKASLRWRRTLWNYQNA